MAKNENWAQTRNELKTLQTKLNQAKVNYGMAEKGHNEFIEILTNDYGVKNIAAAQSRVETLLDQIHNDSNQRDALLAQAASILEKPEMEVSHGTTEETGTAQIRRPYHARHNIRTGGQRTNRTPPGTNNR